MRITKRLGKGQVWAERDLKYVPDGHDQETRQRTGVGGTGFKLRPRCARPRGTGKDRYGRNVVQNTSQMRITKRLGKGQVWAERDLKYVSDGHDQEARQRTGLGGTGFKIRLRWA
jgi:hypothetical protein